MLQDGQAASEKKPLLIFAAYQAQEASPVPPLLNHRRILSVLMVPFTMIILVDRLQNHFQLIIQLVLAAVEGGFVIEDSFQTHRTDGARNDWTKEHQFVKLDAEVES